MSTFSASFRFQLPGALHVSTGTFGSPETGQKFRLTLPQDWDHFWENTRPDLKDVVLTDGRGVTLLTFQRVAGADHATRTLSLDVDGWTAPSGAAVCLFWLHYGHPGATTDHASTATPTSPPAAEITLARPGGWLAQYSTRARSRDIWKKRTDETRDLWVRFPGMAQRRSLSRGAVALEWPLYARVEVYNSTPALEPTMTDLSRLRFAGSQYLRGDLRGGAAAQDYEARFTVVTTEGQQLVHAATLAVRNT